MPNRDTEMAVAVYLADCFETANVGLLKREFAKYQGCTQKSCVDLLRAHKLLAACWLIVRSINQIRPTNKTEALKMLRAQVSHWRVARNYPRTDGVGDIHDHENFKSWTKHYLDAVWRYSRADLNAIRKKNAEIRHYQSLRAKFQAAYTRCGFRRVTGHRSEHTLDIYHQPLHRDPSPSMDSSVWNTYHKNYNWPIVNSRHVFSVDLDVWEATVREWGLAVVDGMLTLDVVYQSHSRYGTHFLSERPTEIYKATWVRQGRGTSLVKETGFIATVDGLAAHGATAKAAIKRADARATDPKYVQARVLIDKCLKVLSPNRMVTLEDSVSAGNCPSGTKDWSEKYLNGKMEVSVGEIEAALRNNDDRLVLVLKVLRNLK